jgi:hypothetical protein
MTRSQKIIDIMQDTDKNYDPYYHVLPAIIKQNNYKTGIEIGVFCGGHAKCLLDSGINLLVGIDPYQVYTPGMPRMDDQADFDLLHTMVMIRLKDEIADDRYRHLRMISDQAYTVLQDYDQFFDFIFIDGLHTYEQLKKDLDNYSTIIKRGGVIACHDYNHGSFPELTTAIDEFVGKHNKKLQIGPLHLVYINW